MTIQRVGVGPRMSNAVVHGDTVYLAGQVADSTAKDVKGQTAEVLAK
ncbi:MAG: RidA family protein, partial [Ferrovibrionaceae bacterium]